MRRWIIIFFAMFIYFCSFGMTVYSEDFVSEIGIDIQEIDENIPPDASEIIEDNGITAGDTEAISKIGPREVLSYLISQIRTEMHYPMKLMVTLFSVIIIGSLIENFGSCIENRSSAGVYETVCVLVAVGIISDPVSSCVKTASNALIEGGNFMVSYIPVFSGIMASSGCITSAYAYSAVLLLCTEAAAGIASDYLMPFVSICTALGIIESLNSSLNLTQITQFISKAVKFVLGFVMTVFIGLLSLQSIIGASADTIGVKTAKFLASNCIPVIGSAVADAYSTLKASIGILRGGVGFFGIAVIFVSVIPPLIEAVLVKLAFCIAETVSGLFGVKGIKTLLSNTSAVLSIIISLLVCFGIMLIISTTVMMMIGLDIS